MVPEGKAVVNFPHRHNVNFFGRGENRGLMVAPPLNMPLIYTTTCILYIIMFN